MDVLDFARRISMIDKPTPISDSFDNEWGQSSEQVVDFTERTSYSLVLISTHKRSKRL